MYLHIYIDNNNILFPCGPKVGPACAKYEYALEPSEGLPFLSLKRGPPIPPPLSPSVPYCRDVSAWFQGGFDRDWVAEIESLKPLRSAVEMHSKGAITRPAILPNPSDERTTRVLGCRGLCNYFTGIAGTSLNVSFSG